jgi:alpha-beta hydrolase superfamily lysophospholipase
VVDREPMPSLPAIADAAGTHTVAILLPGGRSHDRSSMRTPSLAALRMIPFGWSLRRATRGAGVAVWLLRYRYGGWNEPHRDPVRDVAWALDEVRRRHPSATAVLIGHSMGGRAALLAAGDPAVVAVCLLAPWIEPGDPVEQLAGRTVLIAHGDRDRITDPARSHQFAARARRYAPDVRWVSVPGDGHLLLRRARTWNALVTGFVSSLSSDHP